MKYDRGNEVVYPSTDWNITVDPWSAGPVERARVGVVLSDQNRTDSECRWMGGPAEKVYLHLVEHGPATVSAIWRALNIYSFLVVVSQLMLLRKRGLVSCERKKTWKVDR